MVFDAPSFWEYNQRPAAIDDSDQLTADSGQLPLTSCEIVKKYIGYFFFPFSPGGKKAFHSYIDFLLSIGHGQEEGHDFLWYSPFYSFFLRNSSALTFSWQNLFLFFLPVSLSVKSEFTVFLPVDKWNIPERPLLPSVIFHFFPFHPDLFTVIHRFLCISPVDTSLFAADCLHLEFSFQSYQQPVNKSVEKWVFLLLWNKYTLYFLCPLSHAKRAAENHSSFCVYHYLSSSIG